MEELRTALASLSELAGTGLLTHDEVASLKAQAMQDYNEARGLGLESRRQAHSLDLESRRQAHSLDLESRRLRVHAQRETLAATTDAIRRGTCVPADCRTSAPMQLGTYIINGDQHAGVGAGVRVNSGGLAGGHAGSTILPKVSSRLAHSTRGHASHAIHRFEMPPRLGGAAFICAYACVPA